MSNWNYFVKIKKNEIIQKCKVLGTCYENKTIMKKMSDIWKNMSTEEKSFYVSENFPNIPENHGKKWTSEEDNILTNNIDNCLSIECISILLKRTKISIDLRIKHIALNLVIKNGISLEDISNRFSIPLEDLNIAYIEEKEKKEKKEMKKKEKNNIHNKNKNNNIYILNNKQQLAFDMMLSGKNLFLTGSGGVGKTKVIQHFINTQKYNNKIGITSTTGTSAIIFGGSTLHSFLGIGLGKGTTDILYKKINSNKYIHKRWLNLKILIIDEISMLNPFLFDTLEEIARLIKKNELPFGGIQLILSGDFLQLPVVDSDNFCFEALSWNRCITNIINLTEIIRQTDTVFQSCLNNVRIGNITEETIKLLNSRVGVQLINDIGIKPTKLYPLNSNVDYINEKEISKIENEFYQYDLTVQHDENLSDFIVEKYIKQCQVYNNIQLSIGAQVMLLYNLNFEKELVNGSRGIVTRFENDMPIVKFLNGIETIIDFHIWEIKENDKIIISITQIPLKLAYAFTIHKLQGSSLDYVEVDLENIFTYAQAYVSLSRVRNLEGLSIISIDYSKIKAHPKAIEFYNNLL